MVENFIVIQLIFAEKFVSQDFTIRAAPGLSGPANTCAGLLIFIQCITTNRMHVTEFILSWIHSHLQNYSDHYFFKILNDFFGTNSA